MTIRTLFTLAFSVAACALGLAIYQTVNELNNAPQNDNPLRTLTEPGFYVAPGGAMSIGITAPEHPVVFKSLTAPHADIYRLYANGTEWYAPGISREWVHGRLFQLQCPREAQCL